MREHAVSRRVWPVSPLAINYQPVWAIGWCLLILVVAVVWGAVMFRRKAGRR